MSLTTKEAIPYETHGRLDKKCSGLMFYYTKIKQAIRTLNGTFVL